MGRKPGQTPDRRSVPGFPSEYREKHGVRKDDESNEELRMMSEECKPVDPRFRGEENTIREDNTICADIRSRSTNNKEARGNRAHGLLFINRPDQPEKNETSQLCLFGLPGEETTSPAVHPHYFVIKIF